MDNDKQELFSYLIQIYVIIYKAKGGQAVIIYLWLSV